MSSDRMEKPSLVVIGAGVIGLCSALQAQRQGYQVTLVDREAPGKGASFGNAGYIATELVDPLSTVAVLKKAPFMLLNPKGPLCLPLRYLPKLLPWLARFVKAAAPAQVAHAHEVLMRLNREALPAWCRNLADIGEENQLVAEGYLLVWESADKLQEAKDHATYMAECGIPCELVQGERLAELEPEMSQVLSHALFYPEACRVKEPYQLSLKLLAAFKSRGGQHLQADVAEIKPGTAGDVEVISAEGESIITANKAIISAGAWSKTLLAQLGLNVPLEAERGYHVTAPGQAHRIKHTIGSAERKFVLSPLDSGLRAVGMTELSGLKKAPNSQRFEVLKYHTQKLLPGLKKDAGVSFENWMGHRPTLPDSLPVIDLHPEYPQIGFAFGNQHLGLTQAAATAELVIAKMTCQTSFMDTEVFSISRF